MHEAVDGVELAGGGGGESAQDAHVVHRVAAVVLVKHGEQQSELSLHVPAKSCTVRETCRQLCHSIGHIVSLRHTVVNEVTEGSCKSVSG